jgi:hypothetical protein
MKRIFLSILILLWAASAWAIPPMPYNPNAATVTVTDSTDATSYPAMFDSDTGSLALHTDAGLTYNATTGVLTATGFSGPLTGAVTGTASGNIANTLADAAGDLIQGSADNTWAKLTKGAEGTILRAGASSNAYSTSTFADTYAKGTILTAATANTVAGMAHPGAANYILTTNAADTMAWANSLSIATLDMTSGTSTVPWTVSADTLGTYTEGRAHWESDVDALEIGDAATLITLDFTANTTITFPAATSTLSSLAGTETLTNKTITAPYITLPVVDGHTGLSLSAAQVSGTIISNAGQALADVNHTLPAAASGYNFIGFVGTALAATNYYRFTAATAATMCLDGTCGKAYVTIDTPTQGATVACYTAQVSSTGLKNEGDLAIGTDTTAVLTAALEFDIAGTGYAKASAETEPGNDVIPQGKYGAVALDIGADGTIDAVEATDNATGYDSSALALAGLPAVAASHIRIGTVTATKSDGDFTFATTALNAANTTVAYADTAVYTLPYNWICTTGSGTWVTD